MGIYSIKPKFQRSLRPIEDLLVERRVHPDVITLSALAISTAGGGALALSGSHPWLLLAAPAVALTRTALNALDGLVATRTGRARPWGEVLNESSDRLSDVALLGGLALSSPANALLGTAAVVGVLLASYLGIVAKAAGGPRQYGGVMGKADRMVLLSLAGPLAFLTDQTIVINCFFVIVLAGSFLTAIERGVKTHADLQPSR